MAQVGYFTVAHTGTQYWRKHHFGELGERWVDVGQPGDLAFAHCNLRHEAAIAAFNGEIVTTWRDPLKTAVSWYARGKFDRGYQQWRDAWRIWREHVRPRASVVLLMNEATEAPINSVRHNSLAHYLYDIGDLDGLLKLIDANEVAEVERTCL